MKASFPTGSLLRKLPVSVDWRVGESRNAGIGVAKKSRERVSISAGGRLRLKKRAGFLFT